MRRQIDEIFWLLAIAASAAVGQDEACTVPRVDLLFVLDGTVNVGAVNAAKMRDFVKRFLERVTVGVTQSRVGVAQFRPGLRPEFYFLMYMDPAELRNAVDAVPYEPCGLLEPECGPQATASINTVLRNFALSTESGNRAPVSDAVVLITTDVTRPVEIKPGERLYQPISPIHTFMIRVGNLVSTPWDFKVRYAATTDWFETVNFDTLLDEIDPLCVKMRQRILADQDNGDGGDGGGGGGGGAQEVGASVVVAGMSTEVWFIIVVLIVIVLVVLLILCIALFCINNENAKLKDRQDEIYAWASRRGSLRSHDPRLNGANGLPGANGYLHPFVNGQLLESPRKLDAGSLVDLEGSDRASLMVDKGVNGMDQEKETQTNVDVGTDSGTTTTGVGTDSPHLLGQTSPHDTHDTNLDSGVGLTSDDLKRKDDDADDADELNSSRLSELYSALDEASRVRNLWRLPDEHPAKSLPPLDMLLVVDNSGSIGMANFEKVKSFLDKILDDVDVAPGRSRVALVLFSDEPSLHFSFDKYYSGPKVRAAVQRMPYKGGTSFLGRALEFATGVLAQERTREAEGKRRVRVRSTAGAAPPRRLQLVVVVSDGATDDAVESPARAIHEKAGARVAAVGVRAFHKEKLLAVARYSGALFLLSDSEALANWIFKQQTVWQAEANASAPTKRKPKRQERPV